MTHGVKPILVGACGNVMAGDDAFGPLTARALREQELDGVEVVDLDINPAELLHHLTEREALIVLDAVQQPDTPPGELIDVSWFDVDRPPLVNDDALSSHGLSLGDQINLARRLDMLPEYVRLIAVTIDGASVGREVSDRVRRQVPMAVRRIACWVALWRKINPEVSHA